MQTSCQWSRERGLDVLLGGDEHVRVLRREVEERVEAVDGQQLGDVRALLVLVAGGDLGELAVLERRARRPGAISTRVDVAERALRERRELAQRLDLDVEQVDAHRAVGGRRVEVEDLAADRELAAVLDLVDALVAHRGELLGGLVEVEQVALGDREAVRAQLGVGDLLAERDGGDDDDRRLLVRRPARRAARRARRRAGRRGAAAARGATRR